MKREYQVIIIGSGFGGLLAALNLKTQKFDDFMILERRSFIGGTWKQNVYPGAAVDVPSPLYALSSEPYDWSQLYADGKELGQYTDYVIGKHKLREKIQTNCNVTKIEWLDSDCRWKINVDKAEPYYSQFIINASGPLSTPVIPVIKGQESFKARSFHSSNWDGNYRLKGKRVAIIGSGASAAQIIPAIAGDVKHLYVFQRSAHWVMPRNDYVFKPWQRALLKKKWIYNVFRSIIYWVLEYRLIGFKYSQKLLDIVGRRNAEKLIRKQIKDPKMREQVTPDFDFGCKRVLLSETLYPAYCRDNVSLIDQQNGIKEIIGNEIVTAAGAKYEVDLIVYSTGFDATDGVISYPVIGKNGKTLSSVWQDYPRAYLGTCVPEFPNLFIVTGPNTGIGHTSALFLIESQMSYIMDCLKGLQKRDKKVVEVTSKAEQAYTGKIHAEMAGTVWQKGGCNSWYKSKSGKVIAMFPGFSFTYRRWAKRFRVDDHRFSDGEKNSLD